MLHVINTQTHLVLPACVLAHDYHCADAILLCVNVSEAHVQVLQTLPLPLVVRPPSPPPPALSSIHPSPTPPTATTSSCGCSTYARGSGSGSGVDQGGAPPRLRGGGARGGPNSPQTSSCYTQPPASPAAFFVCRLFLWAPLRLWGVWSTCCNRALTKCGLYRTIRRVLDIDGWYLMATEFLECCRCKRKVAAWSQEFVGQLGEGHRALFPAILTYKLACDRGNSATQLYEKLCEAHAEAWMRRSIHYLSVMEPFTSRGVVRRCTPPPKPPPVPQ
ncbi:hypothetical protein R3I93_002325 [Phoxinus phoxinus]|uniref:DUF6729 domain-containing protein n=1 Tax=Phoxinus phoxinus TaxID=58324 RepID=A0AAN9DJF4_9TELE